ncbi:hypothetical protein LLEC1_00785 [Akanthomyces lecanii]|uniref:F-box domain-containing protein n=1 Tax=Cordyceps confragosa TaxID=2714763 RepID=A0A179I873_CORDF|nr:hypothetical protein LLEC1_00785 [Akanthomyces lecanii]
MVKPKRTSPKDAGRQRRADRRRAKDTPASRCSASVAGARVFALEELTKSILGHLPENVLLSTTQRVCRQWRDLARGLLRRLLDGIPEPSPTQQHFGRRINPLLLEHFGNIIDDGTLPLNIGLWLTGSHYWSMRSLIDLPIATCGPGRVIHDAYARAGASWRDMQIYHPPVYEMRYQREPESEPVVVAVPEGVRLGQVYDVLVAVTSNTKGFSWSEVRLTWPQASPSGGHSLTRSDSAENTDVEETVVPRDYILLEKVHHVLAKAACDCLMDPKHRYDCEYVEAKRMLLRIASNKWRVSSRGFKQQDLLVEV